MPSNVDQSSINMNYLFIGDDTSLKDSRITALKTKLFPDPSALSFDYETFHAHKLDAEDFKKALMALPHLAAQRLVVVRRCEKFSDQNKAILLAYLAAPSATTVLVLDCDELDPKSAFLRDMKPFVKLEQLGSGRAINVFDMTRAISSRDAGGALKILHELLEKNIHPLQIMGGVVWFWGKEREKLSPKNFQKGLMCLQEADLNVKRSRLAPEYALEKVIVELAGLI